MFIMIKLGVKYVSDTRVLFFRKMQLIFTRTMRVRLTSEIADGGEISSIKIQIGRANGTHSVRPESANCLARRKN